MKQESNQEMHPLPQNRLLRGAYLMFQRYMTHNVAIQSAALAFYIVFTMFPLLIFINALLGLLQLDVHAILLWLEPVLPSDVTSLVGMYLEYVGRTSSPRLMVFGLVFSIYFPMRAANVLMRAVRTAYHLGPPRAPVRHVLKTLLYTVIFIVTIAMTIVLMSVGEGVLEFAVRKLHLPIYAADLWQRLRFPVTAAVAYFALFLLYAMAQDERVPRRNLYPGILTSMVCWLVFSWLFSQYVENFANYSLLYGSIGAAIVLLVWLNATSITLIMGAELNGTLISMRKDSSTGA